MVIAILALLVLVLIVFILLPYYNMMMQKQLTFHAENLPFIVTCAVFVSLVTGLLAGSYPAFFLSSFNPTRVLKGTSVIGGGSSFLRRALVVFQFVISISLISSIVIIQKQLRLFSPRPLGSEVKVSSSSRCVRRRRHSNTPLSRPLFKTSMV
jgi:putative ABC transport system permease protein